MSYQILPNGEAWANGVFCLPKSVMKKIKFLDAIKLSVLTLAIASDEIKPPVMAAQLRIEVYEVEDALDYWVGEGILVDTEIIVPVQEEKPIEAKQSLEKLPMPSLSPKDIVALSRENSDIKELLRNAQPILGSTIPQAMQSNLVNMVTYYGLSVPVVLTLLQYYKNERDKGKAITPHKLQMMAKEWAELEIDNLDKASDKLQEMEDVKELWSWVIAQCEIDYRKPTATQEKMMLRWKTNFSNDMISYAINVMKKYAENEESRSIKEVDNILKDWKRKGFTTPDDVKSYKKPEQKSKSKSGEKLQVKPTFDIDKIAKDTLTNDDFDI